MRSSARSLAAGRRRLRWAILGGLLALAATAAACEAPPGGRTPAATPGAGATARAVPVGGLAPVSEVERAVVVRVVDGDTVIVDRGLGEERLRYIGIDAPESVKPDTPVEFMGREAATANAALVAGRVVLLERDVSDRDRFDRLLRYVWLAEGDRWLLVNMELVRMGFASAVSFPPDVRVLDELRAAERAARDADRGLWGPATPLP